MNGRSMKMELDGNINNKENIEETFEKIIRNQSRISKFSQIIAINYYKKFKC